MKLRRGGWTWHLEDPSILDSWADRIPELIRHPVKRNGVRSIFRTTDEAGRGYFVKVEEKSGLLPHLRSRFFSKAESECRSAHLLQACGIACAEYPAWGYNGHGGSILVSRALDREISAMEFWYAKARFDDKRKEQWLNLFFQLAVRFREHHLTHPDFHAANVMLDPESQQPTLIDPYGIRRTVCGGNAELRALLAWLPPLRLDLSEEELADRLRLSGLLRSGTEDFVHDLCRRADRRVEKEWENRRKPQILSGNSKFSHTEGCREYRHTLWYEPAPMPPETELLAEELPEEKAERLWLDSFRNQLLCRRMEKVPLIFEKKQGKCRIFSLLYKKNSYFC